MVYGELMTVYVSGDKVLGTVLSDESDELSCYLPLKDEDHFDDCFEVGDDMFVYNFVGTVIYNDEPLHFVERLTVPKFEFEPQC